MAERGTYRSIPCALLAGKDFRALAERPRWIFVVLKMNTSAAGIDIWYPDELVARVSSESGATPDQVRLTLDILEHENWIGREENLVWVVGHITHDPHLTPLDAKHRKSTQRHLAGLPRLGLVRAFIKAHPDWFPKQESASMGLGWAFEGPSKGVRSKKKIKSEKEDLLGSGEPNIGWNTEGAQIWTDLVAPITAAQFGGMMKPVVDVRGWPDAKAGMLCFIELKRDKPKDLSWYRKDANRYIDLSKMPAVDPITRELTERGRMA